jgi:hypothetical protein
VTGQPAGDEWRLRGRIRNVTGCVSQECLVELAAPNRINSKYHSEAGARIMKNITVSAAIGILTCLVAGAETATLPFWPPDQTGPIGPVTVKLTILCQDMPHKLISSKTITNSNSTNYVEVFKSTVTNFTVGNDELLKYLENTFQTNFPAGAQLACNGYKFFVMDSTGSNVVQEVAFTMYFFGIRGPTAGVEHITTTLDSTGLHHSGNDTEVITGTTGLLFNELYFTNTMPFNVQVSGITVRKQSVNLKTGEAQTSFDFEGVGSGGLGGRLVLVKAQVTGKASGKMP